MSADGEATGADRRGCTSACSGRGGGSKLGAGCHLHPPVGQVLQPQVPLRIVLLHACKHLAWQGAAGQPVTCHSVVDRFRAEARGCAVSMHIVRCCLV